MRQINAALVSYRLFCDHRVDALHDVNVTGLTAQMSKQIILFGSGKPDFLKWPVDVRTNIEGGARGIVDSRDSCAAHPTG